MNAELLANRALLGNALTMSPDTLEARVARLEEIVQQRNTQSRACLLYTSPSPRD